MTDTIKRVEDGVRGRHARSRRPGRRADPAGVPGRRCCAGPTTATPTPPTTPRWSSRSGGTGRGRRGRSGQPQDHHPPRSRRGPAATSADRRPPGGCPGAGTGCSAVAFRACPSGSARASTSTPSPTIRRASWCSAGSCSSGERGLVGHSDADVVAHACADALLGAAGLGDIGQHFPDTDPRWAGADSMMLLTEVSTRVRSRGLGAGQRRLRRRAARRPSWRRTGPRCSTA